MSNSTLHIILLCSVLGVIYKDSKQHQAEKVQPIPVIPVPQVEAKTSVVEQNPSLSRMNQPDKVNLPSRMNQPDKVNLPVNSSDHFSVPQEVQVATTKIRSEADSFQENENTLMLTNININETHSCDGRDVKILGDKSRVTLTGYCRAVSVIGPDSTVQVDRTDAMSVIGPSSTVHVNRTDTLSVSGPGSTVYVNYAETIQVPAPDTTVYYRGSNQPKIAVFGPNSYVK